MGSDIQFNYLKNSILKSLKSLRLIVPSYSFNFAFFENYKENKLIEDLYVKLFGEKTKAYLCGSLSGISSNLVLYPFKYVHQMASGANESLLKSSLQIFTENGFQSFCRGLTLSTLKSASYNGLYLGGYYFLKEKHLEGERNRSSLFFKKIYYCQLNSLFSHYVCYPLEVLYYRKTFQNVSTSKPSSLLSLSPLFKEIGFFGLYSGSVRHSVRTIRSSLILVLFDTFY